MTKTQVSDENDLVQVCCRCQIRWTDIYCEMGAYAEKRLHQNVSAGAQEEEQNERLTTVLRTRISLTQSRFLEIIITD